MQFIKRNAFIITAIALFLVFQSNSTWAQSGRISGEYAGCLTEEHLDQFISAAVKKDYRLMNSMLGTSCFSINGREYSVLDRGWTKSKVRIYVGSDFVDLWVPAEAAK